MYLPLSRDLPSLLVGSRTVKNLPTLPLPLHADQPQHQTSCPAEDTARMALLPLSFLAVPAVLVLIAFLSFSSQILFRHLEPCPLTRAEILQLNALVASMLISYYRAVTTDPGRLPRGEGAGKEAEDISSHDTPAGSRRRWCRKCNAPKPPRAHHCSTCQRLSTQSSYIDLRPVNTDSSGRCIPKMDHHVRAAWPLTFSLPR